MKTYIIVLVFMMNLLFACDSPAPKKKDTPKSNAVDKGKTPFASSDAHQFMDWWLKQNKQKVNLNDQFRAKLFYKKDVNELFKYLKKAGQKESLFVGIQDSINGLSYKRFDPTKISATNVNWIDQDRLRSCRKISKEAMWECLQQDYGITDYYYVSSPLFSLDKKWAVVSINYMEASGKSSNGANRLFRKIAANQWEEIAILTYWGKFEAD